MNEKYVFQTQICIKDPQEQKLHKSAEISVQSANYFHLDNGMFLLTRHLVQFFEKCHYQIDSQQT